MGKVKKLERHIIMKRINEALDNIPIDDLRTRENVIIEQPYMRIALVKDTSIIFHFSDDSRDINGNIIKEKENNE